MRGGGSRVEVHRVAGTGGTAVQSLGARQLVALWAWAILPLSIFCSSHPSGNKHCSPGRVLSPQRLHSNRRGCWSRLSAKHQLAVSGHLYKRGKKGFQSDYLVRRVFSGALSLCFQLPICQAEVLQLPIVGSNFLCSPQQFLLSPDSPFFYHPVLTSVSLSFSPGNASLSRP